ncbi:hypothetical protein ABD81_10390 [Bacillus thuringiensis]|uniref:Uncharacterized protein n=1 Tax=Bacillus wiedmannii TaxID=1890302 RepID=A0A242ZEQ1_9BACI|nr:MULTISPECIES: hypothetical protein [Bacillus cereus group]MBG9749945.1 hypothetical protein [Bacillus thuringiensis]MBG9778149.1 hypothetical protein [Bacillus thuringiensis]MBG9924142.1 hypothetical protein [Bacillus thuringiensis]OTX91653.1 hypothetical protein BK730_07840 [Bacillus wiedmannii]OTZ90403.1 hypothetical protein BK771_04640 [Bacillus thuringiensis serovar ostriniae]
MLYHLIKLGEALESEVKQSKGRLYFDSVNFGVWVSKSILYIEKYHKDTFVVTQMKQSYKEIDYINNYTFYKLMLSTLKVIQEKMNGKIEEVKA